MLYRNQPSTYRKYIRPKAGASLNANKEDAIKDISDIPPLPNEKEDDSSPSESNRNLGFIDIFKNRIFLDDIILVGLIFLLLHEGVEDEFLLIILVYLLLAGRD